MSELYKILPIFWEITRVLKYSHQVCSSDKASKYLLQWVHNWGYHSWIYLIETTLKNIQEKKKGGDLNARVGAWKKVISRVSKL